MKLEENRGAIRIFDFVEFKYSIDRVIRQGLICDVYYLNNEKWIKVISNNEIESFFEGKSIYEKHNLDSVYLIKEIPDNNYLTRFVGIVTENSTISNVRFVFNSKICISEGQLLEVSQDGNKVLYQIIEGRTKIESLENKNQTDLIVGEAVQLGKWNYDKCQFEKHGWVPSINTPIYIASAIDETSINDDEYVVGHLPNTNYPVILNKSLAITHHTAIVGVTGTGKSVFARNLIREFLKDNNTKVICIDFTNEYENKFSDLSLKTIVDDTLSNTLFNKIDKIEMIVGKNYNKDNDNSLKLRKEVEKSMNGKLVEFLKGKEQLSIFELPHVENTSGVLSYTKTFFRLLFNNAKKEYNYGKRVCLVLEEVHTIIPEWNFSGVSDKISQPLLNSIAQIALQGRKYNIGLLVIAQRTANVSKTILTQCNSIVSFQEFDKTSSDFLANYFGDEIVKSLPNLRFRQAIAAGKAFRSNTPMIFEVPEIDEKQSE